MNVTAFATETQLPTPSIESTDTTPDQDGISPQTVESLTLNKNEMTLTVDSETDSTGDLTATIALSSGDTDYPQVTWTSSDEAIATVTNTTTAAGTQTTTVTAVKAGTATITATIGDAPDAKTATCTVTVNPAAPAEVPATGVSLDHTTLALTVGGASGALTATVTPENATDEITWESSDTSKVTVAPGTDKKTATVTPVAAGQANITVTVGNQTATCAVTVSAAAAETKPATAIALDKTELALTAGGAAGALTATVTPADTTDEITWQSSDTSKVTVTPGADKKTATITPVAAGTANITVAAGGQTATCAVTVSAPAPVEASSLILDKTAVTLGEGDTATIKATVKPDNAADKAVTWTNSKPEVATIADAEEAGAQTITAVKAGTTVITATTANGISVACTVTVNEKRADTACEDGNHTYDQLVSILKPETCTKNGIAKYTCSKCSKAADKFQPIPASHLYNTGVEAPVHNCGKDGIVTYTCQREGCEEDAEGHTYTETIKATGEHSFPEQPATTAATCTQPGKKGIVCTVCGDAKGEVEITGPALGHQYNDGEVTKEPSCDTTGIKKFTCQREGCTEAEEGHSYEATLPVKHTPGEPVYTPANCTSYGTIKVSCEKCNEVFTDDRVENDRPLGHTPVKIPAVPATCTAPGKTEGEKCSKCNVVLKKQEDTGEVDANNHAYDTTVIKEATCTSQGIVKKTCTRCKTFIYEATQVEHAWGDPAIEAATCAKAGKKTFTCTSCGETKVETIPALAHVYDNGEVTKPATCGADGVKTFTCTNAGCTLGADGGAFTRTESIPKTNKHAFEEKTDPANCTQPERTGRICKVCGEADGQVETTGEPLGHDIKEEIKTAATCTEDGTKKITCKREGCDYEKTETIPAAHTPGAPDYQAPDCVNNGKEIIKCTACQEIIESHDLGTLDPATGEHVYTEHKEVPATCQKAGTTAYKQCNGCKAYENGKGPQEIPVDANAHVFGEDDIVTIKPSDCSTDPMTKGIVKKTCSLCKKTVYDTLEVQHDFKNVTPSVTKFAYCEKDGEQTRVCNKCHKTITETITASGHEYGTGTITTGATCGKDGVRTFTCQNTNCQEDGTKKSYTEKIPATGKHTFEQITTEPTCTEPKHTGSICSVCGVANGPVVEEGEPLGHDLKETINQAATCTEDGKKTITCNRDGCDYEKEETIPAAHGATTSTYQAATCTEPAYDIITCTVCHKEVKRESLEAIEGPKGHTEVTTPAVPATCIRPGKTAGISCSVCKAVIQEQKEVAVDPNHHTYGNYIESQPATCTENGLRYRTCSDCSKNDYDIIPAGHDWSEGELNEAMTAVISTCKRPGCGAKQVLYVEDGYVLCSECGEVTEPVTTPGKDATCTETGLTEGQKCGNPDCGHVLQEQTVIPVLGHTEGAWETETAATCSKPGSEVQKCTVCKTVLKRRAIEPTGRHEYVEEVLDPTCTENTKIIQSCKHCGIQNPDFPPVDMGDIEGFGALGHDFVNGICSRCDKAAAEMKASAIVEDGINKVRFSASIVDFPASAKVVKKGILYITSASYDPAASSLEEDLQVGSSCAYTKVKETADNSSNTIYFDLTVRDAVTRTLYARSYVVVNDGSGDKTYYGDIITTSFQQLGNQ